MIRVVADLASSEAPRLIPFWLVSATFVAETSQKGRSWRDVVPPNLPHLSGWSYSRSV